MPQQFYRFTVGDLACTIINDGYFDYPNPSVTLFANAPQEVLNAALRRQGVDPAGWEAYRSPYPSLLIETKDRCLLVDMGAGSMAPTTGNLPDNLAQAGVAKEKIDTIFITHAHPDHIGGALDAAGRLMFPHARYLIGRTEWEFWSGDPDLLHLQIPDHLRAAIRDCARTTLPALRDRMDFVDAGEEIMPGIEAVAAPGHTPGQLALAISSGADRLLALTDVFLHTIHVEHPEWVAPFDYDSETTVTTRQSLYARAVDQDALITAGHLPWPCLGRIHRSGNGWRWESTGNH